MKALNKKEKIEKVMYLLELGKTVYINYSGYLWLRYDEKAKRQVIMWRNFGESANRKNIKELTWIINTIFDCKYKDFNYSYR